MPGLPIPVPVSLDTSVLQTVSDHGDVVFENVDPPADARIRRVPGGLDELDALRHIFFVNQRNALPMAISHHSLAEVAERGNATYLSWGVRDARVVAVARGRRRNRLHLRTATAVEVLRPTEFWSLVQPWAALLV
jgi:hypothetical protein